jgi:hypothetical protein
MKSTNDSTNNGDNSPFQLAQKICEAVEQGEHSLLPSLLNISMHDDGAATTRQSIGDSNTKNTNFPSSECQELLQVFYSTIGRHCSLNDDDNTTKKFEVIPPAAIKSNLLLRAFLHHIPHRSSNHYQCSLPWEAAIAALQSIQYKSPQTTTTTRNRNNNSASEEMAMMTEIRQFVTNLRGGFRNNKNNNDSNTNNGNGGDGIIENVQYTLKCLLELGHVIIAPLLLNRHTDVDTDGNTDRQNNHHTQIIMKRMMINNRKDKNDDNIYTTSNRREHSYLLPLELLPVILATLDTLDDLLSDLISLQQQQQQRKQQEQVEREQCQFDYDMEEDVEEMNDDANDDNNTASECWGDNKSHIIRYSEKLLSAIYVPFNNNNNNGGVDKKFDKLHRSIRADASLPLLALAIDDIGLDRMAMSVPIMYHNNNNNNNNNRKDVTYWDCLALSLHHVIQSNLICYENNIDEERGLTNDDHEQIINEATNDEGMHLIAPSDYPALIRCVFRMIATNSSSSSYNNNNNSQQQHSLGWESLLLQLYHAAAIVSAKVPNIKSLRPKRSSSSSISEHHSATLSTVESHVLLPSFTGASVMSIRSVLDSCLHESCNSCKQMSVNKTRCWWQSLANDTATPNWAIAGIVLLVMRARSSNLSNSMGPSSSSSFGPRAVFRIASKIMRKAEESSNNKGVNDKHNKRIGLGSNDEIGRALTVLLAIRGGGGEEGSECWVCSDDREYNADADKCALDILGDTYYAGSGKFHHKYLSDEEEEGKHPYEYQLGHKTLTQYANLVCSSLNQGKLDSSGRIQSSESSISETAKTWIDAAYMLLDEMTNSESKQNGSTRKPNDNSRSNPNGTAMAQTIIVVVFCEVPSSQHDIVRSVYDRLVNSSSRTNDSLKRKASEKCFILASLLAWSLLANYERNSSLDIVRRRKGEKGEEAKAVLGPLCNLLTTPAPVYDVFLDTDKPSLSYWALKKLSRSLIPIPSGREAILAMAKKHLRLTSTPSPYSYTSAQVIPFSESMPSTPSAIRDALNFSVDCLCTLIEKHDPSSTCSIPDEYGLEALVMISDMIATSSSSPRASVNMISARVPRVVLSRLLDELLTAVKNSRLNEWVSRRLLRSCFVALMVFFESEGHSSSPVLMTRRVFRSANNRESFRMTADVVAILQLALSIHNFLGRGQATNSSMQRQILSVFSGNTSQRVVDGVLGSEEGEQSSADIDSACLALLLQGVAKAIQNDKFAQGINVDSNVTRQMIGDIVHAERLHYRNEKQQKSSSPSWLDVDHSPLVSSRYHELPERLADSLKMSGEYKDFYASLCNIVVKALLRQNENLFEDEESEFKTEILRCLHHVLARRQRACSDENSTLLPDNLRDNSFDDSSRLILDLSSQHLQRLLLSNAELFEIDLVLRNVLKLSDESECSQPISIASTWKFYCSLDDESSQALISCIKNYYVNKGGWKRVKANRNGNFSLLHIASSECMDENVRYIRCIILDKTSRDLSSIAASKAVLSLEERVANLRVYLRLLLKLCEDWRAGCDGLSGGISKEIFNNFLETTDKCTAAIASSIDNLPARVVVQVKDSFVNVHDSISAVWSIFSENNVLVFGANRFTGMLRLCIDKMPQLLRRAERLVGEDVAVETASNHSITLLEQCLLHLKIESGYDMNDVTAISEETTNTNDKIGEGHNTEPNANSDKLSTRASTPPVEEQCEEREFEIEDEKKSVTMLNISSESVEWIYNCVFTAFQKMWSDYYKLISRGKLNRNKVAPSREQSMTHSLRKRRELSSTLAAICKVFGQINLSSDAKDAMSSKDSMIFAELLSHQGKSALCKCVESIAMTFISSIKHLNQYFQDDRQQRMQHRETRSVDEMKLRDPVICILGWLSSVRENETTHDIITGPIQWYTNEKERLNISMFERSEDYPVFNRLPKLMFRLEVLEAELRKLVLVVNDSRVPTCKEKISLLDQMTNDLTEGDGGSASLPELLQEYIVLLNSRKKEMKIDDLENAAATGGGEDAESDLEGDTARKRPKQQFGPKRKRRMSLRSRNETIDNWLTFDDDDFAEAPGERYNDFDAYVDLEDFIVDG